MTKQSLLIASALAALILMSVIYFRRSPDHAFISAPSKQTTAAEGMAFSGPLTPKNQDTSGNEGLPPLFVSYDGTGGLQTIRITGDQTIQPFGKYVPFVVRKEGKSIYVSMIVKTFDGRESATLIDNEWKGDPGKTFHLMRDSSRLEITGEFGIPLLQIEFLDPMKIQIGGVFIAEARTVSQVHPDFPALPEGSIKASPISGDAGSVIACGKGGVIAAPDLSLNEIPRFTSAVQKIFERWFS